MAQRVDKSHWNHDCGDQADVTAVIVMAQPADLPMLSTQGKSFQGRIYRRAGENNLIHETGEYAEFTAAANAVNRWLADEVSRRIEDVARPKYPELAQTDDPSLAVSQIYMWLFVVAQEEVEIFYPKLEKPLTALSIDRNNFPTLQQYIQPVVYCADILLTVGKLKIFQFCSVFFIQHHQTVPRHLLEHASVGQPR